MQFRALWPTSKARGIFLSVLLLVPLMLALLGCLSAPLFFRSS